MPQCPKKKELAIQWFEETFLLYCDGNRVAPPDSFVRTVGGLSAVEEAELRALEQKQVSLQELRRALGFTHVLDDLPITPSDFKERLELHTPEELDEYLEQVVLATRAAGYILIVMPDRMPPNTPLKSFLPMHEENEWGYGRWQGL